jgi:hypothetical protein
LLERLDRHELVESRPPRISDVFKHLEKTFDIIPRLIAFLCAFYEVLLLADAKKLDYFIFQYQNDSIEAISIFASGLKRDYEAVKNCLIYHR